MQYCVLERCGLGGLSRLPLLLELDFEVGAIGQQIGCDILGLASVLSAPMLEADAAGLHHAEEQLLLLDAVAVLAPHPVFECRSG